MRICIPVIQEGSSPRRNWEGRGWREGKEEAIPGVIPGQVLQPDPAGSSGV